LCTSGSYLFSLWFHPGNLFPSSECGIYKPESHAPFNAPKILFPVVVLVKPTSKLHLNGLGPVDFSSCETKK